MKERSDRKACRIDSFTVRDEEGSFIYHKVWGTAGLDFRVPMASQPCMG